MPTDPSRREAGAGGGEGVQGLGEAVEGRAPVVGEDGEGGDDGQERLDPAVDLQHALEGAELGLGAPPALLP